MAMKKGQRPSRHVRRVRTKKGKKKVLVNPKIKKRIKKKRDKRNFSQGIFQLTPQSEEERRGIATLRGAQRRTTRKFLKEQRKWEQQESLEKERRKIREEGRIAFGKLGRFDKLKESEQETVFERLARLQELRDFERVEAEQKRKVPKERLKRFGRAFGREAARFATRKTREKERARETEKKEKEDIRKKADTAKPVEATVVEDEEQPPAKPLGLGISEEEIFKLKQKAISKGFKPRQKEMPRKRGRPPKAETIFRGTGIEVIQ